MVVSPAPTAGRILDVAERLVQTRGYNGFSYADISAELRIRNASVHYHFPSKADLGKQLVARYRENFMAALAGVEAKTPDARRRLRTYVGMWASVLRDRHRMCLCGMMAADLASLPAVVRTELKRFFNENEAWLVSVLTEGRKAKTLRLAGTPEVEARLLTMGLEGAMLVARSYGEPQRFDEIGDRLLEGLGIAGSKSIKGHLAGISPSMRTAP